MGPSASRRNRPENRQHAAAALHRSGTPIAEIAEGKRDINEESIETGVALGGFPVREMEELRPNFEGLMVGEGNVEAGTIIGRDVQAPRVGHRCLLREREHTSVHLEEGLSWPMRVRNELQSYSATTAKSIFAGTVQIVGIES